MSCLGGPLVSLSYDNLLSNHETEQARDKDPRAGGFRDVHNATRALSGALLIIVRVSLSGVTARFPVALFVRLSVTNESCQKAV